MQLFEGQHIRTYTLQRRLGVGGMAEVWAALHTDLGVEVAIKVLFSRDPSLQGRLMREGRAQARLAHPNILAVHDVVSIEGAPGLVMPLVQGPPLSRMLRHYRPDEAEAAALFSAVVAGVGHAHRSGLVHRDLKPANVLLHLQGPAVVPLVSDFGLVKASDDLERTRSGALMGTMRYAAPEQLLDASAVDHRADLFSLGVMLVELLSGQRPFVGRSLGELLAEQRGGPSLGGVPAAWRPLCVALLAHAPEDRPESCDAVAAELDALRPRTARDPLAEGGSLFEAARHLPPGGEPLDTGTVTSSDALSETAGSDISGDAPHNLPEATDPFVGRDHELAALARLIAQQPLVSVLGTGGSGKTRLALTAAWGLRDGHPGGVWLCDLSAARDAAGVCAVVSQALGLEPSAEAEELTRAIAAKGRCLLLLDNFEQVAACAAETVGRWRAAAPLARFLITSRVSLGLPGEAAYRLRPLAPGEAAALFAARARAHEPRFVLDDSNREDVMALVALLDGLPLAIELAAARIRLMRPAAMLSRMNERFKLLRGQDRALRAAIDWSWDLLDAPEQAAFAQCSVFRGAFTLQAAEAVVVLPEEGAWAADVIGALVDKSLLRSSGDSALGEPQLVMLLGLRAYAEEKLRARGHARACQDRHLAFFAALGERYGLRDAAFFATIAEQHALRDCAPSLEAAARHAVAIRDGRAAALAACGLTATVRLRGGPHAALALLGEAAALLAGSAAPGDAFLYGTVLSLSGRLENVLHRQDRAVPLLQQAARHFAALGEPVAQARARTAEAFSHNQRNRWDEAEALYRRAIAISQQHGDRRLEADATVKLGNQFRHQGQMAASEELLCRARDIYDAIDAPPHVRIFVISGLGALYRSCGRAQEAEALFREALAIDQRSGDRKGEAVLLGNLASLYLSSSQIARADQHARKALAIQRQLGDRAGEALSLVKLARVKQRQERYPEAARLYQRAIAIMRELGQRAFEGATHCNLGSLLYQQGRLDEATAHIQASLEIARELGDRRSEGFSLCNLAMTTVARGEAREGAALYLEALACCRETQNDHGVKYILSALADLSLRQGDHDATRRWLDEAEVALSETDGPAAHVNILCTRAELAHACDDPAGAARALDEARRLAEAARAQGDLSLIARVSTLEHLSEHG